MPDAPKTAEKPEAQATTPAPIEGSPSFFDSDEGKTGAEVGTMGSESPAVEATTPVSDFVSDEDLLTDGAPAETAVTVPEPAEAPVSTKQEDLEHAATVPLAPVNLDDPNQQTPTGQTTIHDDSELVRLRQQVAHGQQQEQQALARQQLADETAAFATKMRGQGFEEQAVEQATAVFQQGRTRELQTVNAAEGFITNDRAKVDMAHILAEKHKLGIAGARELLIYDSPVAMTKAAENAERISRLEAGQAELKQGRVKSQTFDDGGSVGPTANSKAKLDQRYADGEILSESEMAIIFPNQYGTPA